jgi:hypothetical protein
MIAREEMTVPLAMIAGLHVKNAVQNVMSVMIAGLHAMTADLPARNKKHPRNRVKEFVDLKAVAWICARSEQRLPVAAVEDLSQVAHVPQLPLPV